MTEITRTYGLLLKTENSSGIPYVKAYIVSRETGKDHPLGLCSEAAYDKKGRPTLALDGLGLQGFVSDYPDRDGSRPFLLHDVAYHDLYSIEQTKAERMARTLKRINKAMETAKAYEPGDKFAVLCDVLGLTFCCEKRDPDVQAGLRFSGTDWRWMDCAEGRNRFRDLIRQAVDKANGKADAA